METETGRAKVGHWWEQETLVIECGRCRAQGWRDAGVRLSPLPHEFYSSIKRGEASMAVAVKFADL